MRSKSGHRKLTTAKFICNLLPAFVLSFSCHNSLAIEKKSTKAKSPLLASQGSNSETSDESNPNKQLNLGSFTLSSPQPTEAETKRLNCKDARRDLRDSKAKISEACKKAGLGNLKDCLDAAMECGQVAGETTYSSTSSLLGQLSPDPTIQAMANSLGTPEESKRCPQMSGRDYFTEKDKIERDLDSTKEDLSKLNDKKADVEESFNKEIADLQDSLNKAQEELERTKLEIKDKNRKQLSDFQSQQNQAKEELRKKGTETLNLRGRLMQSQQDHAMKLIAMTEASGKRACMRAVADAKKAYEATATTQSRNYIANANKRKQDLLATYNDCMDTFYQQRNALNKNKQQENDQINKDLTDTQQSIEELQNSINSASNTLAEMQADAKTEEQNATQKVLKLMENTQQKIAAAQQKMQSNLQAIAQQNMNLNQKLNRLNNSLMTLGPAPSRGTEYSPAQAASDISTGVSDSLDLMQGNDTKGCFSEEKTDERLKNQYQKFNKGIQ